MCVDEGYMKPRTTVSISQTLMEAILENAKLLYPKETILLLRGEKSKDAIKITGLIVPPLATYGQGFANIPTHMLPMDFSIIGTVHSHPSGNLMPSPADLNHFLGKILMIVGFPFADSRNVAAYNNEGERLTLEITET
ncbi:MAG: Mov34/MPN/PAD-1 family protein [Candidatus Bathyarchaeia archaeon]